MSMGNCELCDMITNNQKIYLDTAEILIAEVNDNLVVGCLKEHKTDMSEKGKSGLIKAMTKNISRNKPGKVYSFKKADDVVGHFGVYATIK